MRSTLSQTCVCWKRAKPCQQAVADASGPRHSMLARLYDADEAVLAGGAAKVQKHSDIGCKSEKQVPRVFQGR